MDNELFELCRNVHGKTGWFRGLDWVIKVNEGLDSEYISRKPFDEDDVYGFTYEMAEFGDGATPLYTSDYLLEKLPKWIDDVEKKNAKFILIPHGRGWTADYMGTFTGRKADTPLKALLKLTLALHEAGELNHD